jgi:hypothetical protein
MSRVTKKLVMSVHEAIKLEVHLVKTRDLKEKEYGEKQSH